MATKVLLATVEKDRVRPENPAKNDNDLDVKRCAALHNTLMLYGWVQSGKSIRDLQKRSWWSMHGSQALEKHLRKPITRYLMTIFDVPYHNFFYHLSGLARPPQMLELGDVLEDQDHDLPKAEKYRFLILYNTPKSLVGHPAGLVYDQQTNKALLMPTYSHIFDLKGDLPWQKLDVILSAYFDMIEDEKALAVYDVDSLDSAPKGTNRDLVPRKQYKTEPWLLQPYTLGDLHSCLDVWKRLVKIIEKGANIAPPNDNEPPGTLCTKTALDIAGIPKGFAYELLLRAYSSEIWFVAPGIRLPKIEEFLSQPFKAVYEKFPKETADMKMPFLFLRCPGTVSAKDAHFRWPFSTLESVPCGLYLDAFPNAANPFEDACRLVLPIRLGDNKYARTSDYRPIRKSHADLYQTGVNPFVMRHGPKLIGILENWLDNVESGHWTVNAKGVEGGIGVWRKADTREDWWRYQSHHLYL